MASARAPVRPPMQSSMYLCLSHHSAVSFFQQGYCRQWSEQAQGCIARQQLG